jgi:hypothetical protein
MAPAEKLLCICWICGAKTTLENCKVDEYGLPVHDECQALRLSLQNRNPPKRENATVPAPESAKKTG